MGAKKTTSKTAAKAAAAKAKASKMAASKHLQDRAEAATQAELSHLKAEDFIGVPPSSNGDGKSVAGSAKDNTVSQEHYSLLGALRLLSDDDPALAKLLFEEKVVSEDTTCVLCDAKPEDEQERSTYEYFEDGDTAGDACRKCISFCERCMESRRKGKVTWFKEPVDKTYSACDQCWKDTDDNRV